jgi:hypothetical protein
MRWLWKRKKIPPGASGRRRVREEVSAQEYAERLRQTAHEVARREVEHHGTGNSS